MFNGDSLIVLFTGVVAVSTVAYAILTWKLVSETRRMRQVQTEPRVSMQLELGSGVGHGGLQLEIRNEGMGPATEIRFEFDGDANYFTNRGLGRPITEVPVIKEGIDYLGPDRNFSFVLGWLFGEDFSRAMEAPWKFNVAYKNLSGKKMKDTFILDFSQFSHLIVGAADPLRNIEKHLDAIQKELKSWSTGTRKPQIIIQTKAQQRKEWAEHIQRQMDIDSEDSQFDLEESS